MIEVLKTNVNDPRHAALLIAKIERAFADYRANFDLQDCDKILRVVSPTGSIHTSQLIELLKDFGFEAEVLADEYENSLP